MSDGAVPAVADRHLECLVVRGQVYCSWTSLMDSGVNERSQCGVASEWSGEERRTSYQLSAGRSSAADMRYSPRPISLHSTHRSTACRHHMDGHTTFGAATTRRANCSLLLYPSPIRIASRLRTTCSPVFAWFSLLSIMSRFSSLLVFCLLLLSLTCTLAAPGVVFTLNSDSTATVRVNGATWLRTSAIWFTAGGKRYSSDDSSLTLTGAESSEGVDSLGQYNATVLEWQASDDDSLRWMTIYRTYLARSSPAIVFDQVWLSDSADTSVGNSDAVLSAFPSFVPKGSSEALGALQWSDGFDGNHEFAWSGPNATASPQLSRGGTSGPLVLFDRSGRVAVTISPFSSFMSASLAASKAGIAEYGVVGSMKSVPAGYSLSTIAVFGDSGVTNTVLAWGDALLVQYGKLRQAAWEEQTTRYLGYATDNGAYYYVSHDNTTLSIAPPCSARLLSHVSSVLFVSVSH